MRELYVITTGYTGESYERCYVWADNEESARKLFDEQFGVGGKGLGSMAARRVAAVERLFSMDDSEFITKLSDSGFDR